MTTNEKIEAIRKELAEKKLDAYIVNTADPHMSEYITDYYKSREWITGFTGSAGTAVITKDEALLWADGRYYIQAAEQISGSNFKLMKLGLADTPSITKWLKDNLKENAVVGVNGEVYSYLGVKQLKKEFKRKKIKVSTEHDLISPIWKDRPPLPLGKTFILDIKYAGKSSKEKLSAVREKMAEENADYYLVASVDDVAWLYNVRGRDVANNPVVISYALVEKDKAYFYVDEKKVTDEVRESFKQNNIEIRGYEDIFKDIGNLKKGKVLAFSGSKANDKLISAVPEGVEKLDIPDITEKLKTIKNETEIKNQYTAYVKDGVALTKFFMWLEKELPSGKVTEKTAADKIHEYRTQDPDFIEESFDSISAFGANAAMMHYNHENGTPATLEPRSFYLLDSGGQYFFGTTDITRTVSLGELTEEEKKDYTLTLQSVIRLTEMKFLEGTTGPMLDTISRAPMWKHGMDYKCGTGHGVGYYLNVHEGPQRIANSPANMTAFEVGMVTSNEPGVYKEGKHGIRIENIMVCLFDRKTPDGNFFGFDTFTRVYIDTKPVIKEMLSDDEIKWLNDYNKVVYDDLCGYLNDEEKSFLREKTKSI